MKKSIYFLSIACLLFFYISCTNNNKTEISGVSSGDKSSSKKIEWLAINDGLAKAAAEKKFLLVDVYTDWCGWCKKMDDEVYSNASISEIISAKFIAAKFNPEKDGEVNYKNQKLTNREFAEKIIGVEGFPSLAVFSPTGDFTSKTAGYIPVDAFIQMLNDIQSK